MQIKINHSLTAPFLIFIMYILLTASNFMELSGSGTNENIFLTAIIMQIMIFVIPGIIYCKFRGTSLHSNLRIKPITPNKIWLSVCSFFVLVFGAALIKLALYSLGAYANTSNTIYDFYLPGSSGPLTNVLYIVIAISIIPAITEEFIFRGVLLGEYSTMRTKKSTAIICSSLLFAMMHFNLAQLPVYFFGGVVLAAVALITDSILCSMIVHLLNNLYGLLFEQEMFSIMTQTESTVFMLFVLAVFFMIFTVLALQATERIYYIKGINGEKSAARSKKSTKKKFSIDMKAFVSPTFILCIITFIVVTFIIKR